MKRANWQRMSAVEHEQIWRSWREGIPIKLIARALGRAEHGVRCLLEGYGGYVPRLRQRRAGQFTAEDREEIFAGISAGLPARAISARVCKHHSSVSREIKRNGGRECYRPSAADQAAWERARRPKICLLRQRPRLCRYVVRGLCRRWSPEQIHARLARHYRHDDSMRVSAETIYRTLFVQSRGALRKELTQHLRSGRTMRHAKKASPKGRGRGQIVDAVSISQRPAEAADRQCPVTGKAI